jgi:hypothetical protein
MHAVGHELRDSVVDGLHPPLSLLLMSLVVLGVCPVVGQTPGV